MEQLTIFCAYAPEDKFFYQELKKQLQPLRGTYQFKVWSSNDILPGMDQAKEVDKQFNLARIILLLISPDFMNSDFCNAIKKRAFASQQANHPPYIIPILLRPVDWQI